MVGTESYTDTERIAALEQRQRRIVLQVRWLLFIAILLTVLACYQQVQNHWLITQNQYLVEMLKLMQPFSGLPRL